MLGVLSLVAPLSGCFRYVPVATPEPGVRTAFELNDRGRAALAESIGPAVREVEGTVMAANGSYELRVHTIRQFSGQSYVWAGEPLAVPRDFVSQARERRLDKGRSWMLGIGVVAAVALVAISTDLFTGGGFISDTPGGGPPGEH